MKSIVQQIHEEFFTASDKITSLVVSDKAKVLYDLGFTSSEDSKEFDPEREKLKRLIWHYQNCYPNNKFITDDEVTRICKKYNLICGPVASYTGKVPDSKVKQIASFTLNWEDRRGTEYEYKLKYHKKSDSYSGTFLTSNSRLHKILPSLIKGTDKFWGTTTADEYLIKKYKITEARWLVDAIEETTTEYKGLFICAPEKDMKTEGLQKRGVFAMFQTKRHIEDPVVLHPCKEGWLILAAWGEEASDENVVNHKMN